MPEKGSEPKKKNLTHKPVANVTLSLNGDITPATSVSVRISLTAGKQSW